MFKVRAASGTLAALFATSLVLAAVAFADNAHFVRASAARSGDNLVVSFKEAGLGDSVTVTIRASAQGTASYECINGGDNHPQAANKETVSSEVSASGNFTSGKNGTVSGSLTVHPPGPGDFSCPPGQRLSGPFDVSYTNVSVTDETNGATASIAGSY